MRGASALEASLSTGERTRAARFRFPRDRLRFVLARGVLRDILSRYLDVRPAAVRLSCGRCGKPTLSPAMGAPLAFNLSHSDRLAIYGVALGCAVGVDVERFRSLDAAGGAWLSPEDRSWVRSQPAGRRGEARLWCWTRTEARLKALGTGWGSPRADRPLEGWVLPLIPAAGYVGAIALPAAPRSIAWWDWRGASVNAGSRSSASPAAGGA